MFSKTHRKLWIYFGLAIVYWTTTDGFLSEKHSTHQCPLNATKTTQTIAALVLARGGSKGIPLKNLAKVAGVSLLGRALRVINNCLDCFDEIWVSTDNESIAQEARRYNANVHYRSKHSARDEATSIEAVQEFLIGRSNIENIALVQCTSVFISENYLEAAVELFKNESNVDCVFSVYRSFKLRWKQESNSTSLQPINFDPKHRPRRQDWPGELVEAGMFYFAKRQLIENGVLQNDGCGFVEINERHALEIDNPFHLNLANILVNISNF